MAQAIDLPDFRAWYNYAMSHRAQTFFALGMLLGLLALVTPWYAIDVNNGGRHNPVRDITLTSFVDHYFDGHFEVYPLDTTACRCATVASAMNGVFILAVVGALIGAGTVFAHFNGRIKGDLTLLLIALTGLMFISAPILMASSLPGAFAADNFDVSILDADDAWGKSFFGANQTGLYIITWAPTTGFFLSLGAGVFMLLCVYQIRMPKRPALAPGSTPGAPVAYSQMTPVPPPPAPAPTPMPPPRL